VINREFSGTGRGSPLAPESAVERRRAAAASVSGALGGAPVGHRGAWPLSA